MSPQVIVAIVTVACVIAFDVYCLADLTRAEQVRYLPKPVWALIICFSNPWGGLAYLGFGRVGRPAGPQPVPALGPGPELPAGPVSGPAALGSGHRSPVTIEVDQLSKRFGPVTALEGLSFTIRPGLVTGFLGPNGAGKTTTMRIILGLDAPTSGSALVGGRPYRQIVHPLHRVGALLDAGALHPGRSAYAHVLSVAQSNGIGGHRVAEVLRLTGMDAVAHRRVREFSLGMKQRLGIAAALVGDPQVLLFDEPVNGLDPEGVQWVRRLFKSLAAEGRTVLVSSHLMTEMALTADHLIIIGRGKLLADMSTTQFIESSTRKDVLVRSPQAAGLARLLAAHGAAAVPEEGGALAVTGMSAPAIADLASRHGIPVHELTPRLASLEEAYLDITKDSIDYRAGNLAGEGTAAQ
jgi:ABC-2 type transport system ATP-binding protein